MSKTLISRIVVELKTDLNLTEDQLNDLCDVIEDIGLPLEIKRTVDSLLQCRHALHDAGLEITAEE